MCKISGKRLVRNVPPTMATTHKPDIRRISCSLMACNGIIKSQWFGKSIQISQISLGYSEFKFVVFRIDFEFGESEFHDFYGKLHSPNPENLSRRRIFWNFSALGVADGLIVFEKCPTFISSLPAGLAAGAARYGVRAYSLLCAMRGQQGHLWAPW